MEPIIELREITIDNFRECIGLSVADDQRDFVASNVYSLAQAKVEPELIPLAIYSDGEMVGFTMYCLDSDTGTGYIDRLMVAEPHQGRGYGRSATRAVISRLRSTPGCLRVHACFVPANEAARALYHGLGFRETGEVDGGQTVVALEFSEQEREAPTGAT